MNGVEREGGRGQMIGLVVVERGSGWLMQVIKGAECRIRQYYLLS